MKKNIIHKLKGLSCIFLPNYTSIVVFLIITAFFSSKNPVIVGVITIACGAIVQMISFIFFGTEDLKKIETKHIVSFYVFLSFLILITLSKIYAWSFNFKTKKKIVDYNYYG